MTSELRVDKIIPTDGVPTGGGGGIIQVIFGSTTTQASQQNSATTQNTLTDTNLTATITPKFSTSKILVQAFQHYEFTNGTSTQMQGNLYICDGSNNILDGKALAEYDQLRVKEQYAYAGVHPMQLLHSPNTTSAFTYKVRMNFYYVAAGTGTMYAQIANRTNCVSTITLMEISA